LEFIMHKPNQALGYRSLWPTGLIVAIGLYALAILLANLTLNHFIPLPVFGMLSVGTLFFAAVFTLRDHIHRAGGLTAVYFAIALALTVNVVAAIWLDTPMRFIGASFLAILVSELADTAVYQRLIHRSWWTRVLASNAVSVPLDSVIFTLLAFYGDMSNREMAEIVFADVLAKFVIAAVFAIRLRRTTQPALA
jgi:uncharacterized PurR-regulated membrane protein YhhQ (DUF165 family)